MSDEQQPEPKTIRLDQFMKLTGIAGTGGQAKQLIQGGEVRVNGAVETRRGRQLIETDEVQFDGRTFLVAGFDVEY